MNNYILKNLTDADVQLLLQGLALIPLGQSKATFDKVEFQIGSQIRAREMEQQLKELEKQNEVSKKTEDIPTT